jgi:K+-sensing histidine kinase KdpD
MPRFYYGEPLLIMHLFHDLCEYCLRQDTRGCVVVDLNAEPEGGKLYTISITITISGNGIPRDEEEKHFLPAKMAENKAGDDTVFASLYYVRTICRIFGGDISVRNSPGFGTRFMAKIRLSTIEE